MPWEELKKMTELSSQTSGPLPEFPCPSPSHLPHPCLPHWNHSVFTWLWEWEGAGKYLKLKAILVGKGDINSKNYEK